MAYQSSHTGQAIDEAVIKVSQLLDLFYPVGSIYTSTRDTNPAATLGGTWTQIKDRFLLCAGDNYTAGSTGGTATHTHTSAAHTHTTKDHTLTVAQMPSHTHNMTRQQWYSADSVASAQTGSIYSWKSGTGAGGNTSYSYLGTYDIHAAGSGQAHNHGNTDSTTPGATGSSSNLPPYKVVYAWERTA